MAAWLLVTFCFCALYCGVECRSQELGRDDLKFEFTLFPWVRNFSFDMRLGTENATCDMDYTWSSTLGYIFFPWFRFTNEFNTLHWERYIDTGCKHLWIRWKHVDRVLSFVSISIDLTVTFGGLPYEDEIKYECVDIQRGAWARCQYGGTTRYKCRQDSHCHKGQKCEYNFFSRNQCIISI